MSDSMQQKCLRALCGRVKGVFLFAQAVCPMVHHILLFSKGADIAYRRSPAPPPPPFLFPLDSSRKATQASNQGRKAQEDAHDAWSVVRWVLPTSSIRLSPKSATLMQTGLRDVVAAANFGCVVRLQLLLGRLFTKTLCAFKSPEAFL